MQVMHCDPPEAISQWGQIINRQEVYHHKTEYAQNYCCFLFKSNFLHCFIEDDTTAAMPIVNAGFLEDIVITYKV